MDDKLIKPLLAEFIGTFTLVFVGAAAVSIAGSSGGVAVPAFAHGLVVLAMAFMYGPISGGHFNPAVTAGLLVAGKIDAMKAVMYWAAQLLGGILGGVLMAALMGGAADFNFGQTLGSISPSADFAKVLLIEAVLTFFLVSAIFQSAVFNRAKDFAPIAIGFTLTVAILAGGPYTGASLNPARTLGPALAAGDLSYIVPYILGPLLGAVVAALLHSRLLNND
jgi:aquaporin Z